MTDHVAPPVESALVASLEDRLRAMQVTLLFIAVLLCVMVGLTVLVIAAQ